MPAKPFCYSFRWPAPIVVEMETFGVTSGSELIYDDPAFEVAMETAYWLDELLCDWAAKDVSPR